MDTIQLRIICPTCGSIHNHELRTTSRALLEEARLEYTFECWDCRYLVTATFPKGNSLTKQSGERGEKND